MLNKVSGPLESRVLSTEGMALAASLVRRVPEQTQTFADESVTLAGEVP